jgi:hypothetical protein
LHVYFAQETGADFRAWVLSVNPADSSVLIVGEAERAEAKRLVGAHRACVNDKDSLASVVVAGRLAQPVIVASGSEAGGRAPTVV